MHLIPSAFASIPSAFAAAVLVAPVLAGPQTSEAKPLSTPPQMEDVLTPPPPPPIKTSLPPETGAFDACLAPIAPPTRSIVGHGYLAGFARGEILYDEPGDGRIWVATDSFKASFGAEGATYVPFFGSAAPKSFPIRFELRSVRSGGVDLAFDRNVPPVRDGDRIVFARGIVDEVYDLSSGAIEQSFVLAASNAGDVVIAGAHAGDVVLEIGVESELARSSDDRGLVLASDRGKVRYGQAFVRDALGARSAVDSQWADDSIRITVPAERALSLGSSLVIDPVISTFDVDDDSTVSDTNPDVAFDVSSGYWMAVYEREFTATDHDVFYRVFWTNGAGVSLGSIDISTVHWATPKIANNNIANQFLCVAAAGDPSGGARSIRGRTRTASGSLGSQFTISGPEIGDKYAPDVGGDPSLVAPTYYCVVYERDTSTTNHDIHARLVQSDSTIHGSTIFVSNTSGTLDNWPSISKGDGADPAAMQDWNLVWQRNESLFDNDLWAAQIHWNGNITTLPFAVDTTSANTFAARVSTSTSDDSRRYMIVCMRTPTAIGSANTYGYSLHDDFVMDTADLTLLAGAPGAEYQWYPSVDCDGAMFVVADQESAGTTTDYNVFVSTFQLVIGTIVCAEGHQALATSGTSERVVEVACAASSGGVPQTAIAVWSDVSLGGSGDIEAGVYQANPFATYCEPGHAPVPACACSNPPAGPGRGCNNSANTGGAKLAATGNVNTDTVVLHASGMLPSALCVFSQGVTLFDTGMFFGDGLVCAGASVLRLATKSAVGGAANYPVGADPSLMQRASALGHPILPGSRSYYFVYYRDPASFGCSAVFNATTTLQVQW